MPPTMLTCPQCREEFEPAWSDEEARAEAKELHGDWPMRECVVVCGDCFRGMPCVYCGLLAPEGHKPGCRGRRIVQ